MAPSTTSLEDRRRIARKYGHPWPWRVTELVEKYVVDRDVDYRDLATEWGVSTKVLGQWIRRHGFRTENYQAVR